MDFSSKGEISEIPETEGDVKDTQFSQESLDKFDKLMGDDKIEAISLLDREEIPKLEPSERESKFSKMFDIGDFFKKPEVNTMAAHLGSDQEISNVIQYSFEQNPDILKKREANSEYVLDGDTYETDGNGDTYRKNGELLPNTEYMVNRNTYRTDEYGRKVECNAEPEYTEGGTRNTKEQKESGGEERQENDDGGHIIAKILGGAEGDENLVPMRRTINRGDYKKMENEIANALQEGKDAAVHIDLKYEGDSQRPSKIRAEYKIDGEKTIAKFDNQENSTELLASLDSKIRREDYDNLKAEIEDMKADGLETSITSVKTEYDENDEPIKVTVGLLDETTGEKTYKVYEAGQEA